MHPAEQTIQQQLFALRDATYRDFQAKLMPTVEKDTIIGVRTPAVRKLAASLAGTPTAAEFLRCLPHPYYDENNLHGFLIEKITDYTACIAAVNAFLPYIDNWATCDLMAPKVFKKNLPALLGEIRGWLASGKTYTVRYGIGMLMHFYLDEAFQPEYLALVAAVRSEEYYVNMMVAWYFATALAKQYTAALPYLTQHRLAPWAHNKAIQKAVESYRITAEQKVYLKTLKLPRAK
ncbi:MAG: DNA alkylation repair protein [Gemmiger sp.]|nr:DNA alkylation repair protein [Gemmiger sp.]